MDKILDRALEIQAEIDKVKKLYAELDLLTEQLVRNDFTGMKYKGQ